MPPIYEARYDAPWLAGETAVLAIDDGRGFPDEPIEKTKDRAKLLLFEVMKDSHAPMGDFNTSRFPVTLDHVRDLQLRITPYHADKEGVIASRHLPGALETI